MIKNSDPDEYDNKVDQELPEISKFINLKSVASTIEFDNVITLNLSNSNIQQLPEKLNVLKNLRVLNLSNNELEDLPCSYAKFKRLMELDISSNKFKSIPKCVALGMGTLKVLDVSKNPKIKMNIAPFSKYLEKFYASDNQSCDKFPDWILSPKFFNIREFNFDRTKFEVFSFVGSNRELYLNSISLACSNLSSPVLSTMLENVVHINKINVGNQDFCHCENVFSGIPIDVLKNPQFLTELNFRGTDLSFVPATISRLCKLKRLDFGKNNISWFPEEICELQELESLKIDGNNFLLLPKNIGNLKSLGELRAETNCISSLPESFVNLTSLKYCDFYDNLFKEFPKVLLDMKNLEGLDIEMNYFCTDDMVGKLIKFIIIIHLRSLATNEYFLFFSLIRIYTWL